MSNEGNNQNSQNGQNYQQNQTAPMQESVNVSEPAVEKPVKKKGSPVKKTVAIVLILAAALVGGYFVLSYFGVVPGIEIEISSGDGKKTADSANGVAETENQNEEGARILTPGNDNIVTLELYPKASEDIDDWEKIGKTLKERVKLVDENAELVVGNKKMTLNIKKDFADSPVSKKTLINILTSAGNCSLGINTTSWYDDFEEGVETVSVKSSSTEEFITAFGDKISESSLEKIQAVTSGTVYYLHTTFNEDGKEDFDRCIKYVDEKSFMNIQIDAEFVYAEGENSISPDLILAGEVVSEEDGGSGAYIIPTDIMYSENNVKLLKSVMESDSMGSGVSYVCVDEPTWESGDAVTGQYQKENIDGNYVIVEYTEPTGFSYSMDYTSGDMYDAVEIVKKRIDSIGVPYSIGYRDIGENSFALKINPEEISIEMLRMLINDDKVRFMTQFQNSYVYASELEFTTDAEGKPAYRVEFYDTRADILQDLIEYSEGKFDASLTDIPAGTTFYMLVNDVTVASADLANVVDLDEYTSELYFNTWQCMDASKVSADDTYIKLINYIYSEDGVYIKAPWEDIKVTYYEDGKISELESEDIPWKYSTMTEVDNSVFEIVENNGAEVHKMISKRNAIVIEIEEDADEDFVTSFAEKVKKIYTECNFDGGAYTFVKFKVKGAGEVNPSDRADISFRKDIFDAAMEFDVYGFYGPTYSDYSFDFYELREADEFFVARKGY